ncbi:histidine-containing phosphotransfer protein 1-like [Vigna radiata var. radiata]|uniref:Histidine-containing phosphotransfer protein n=1 Tax=Vigna radiata var. radiata TaxID=3916 RepID=A0A1S3TGN0_VIGRR|nr:histidine-containing phosphotransfer protein 1-like [Vigna radiata var. radiata]XP_014492915.1 histidine-containing phosphotransfer protein 1-like [Vigna radiata var. radiata]XP_022634258.1 histidine-containing phosphotransfer protein 1-like [Vigna radiata var. radiata]XP_022634259.1 histidine-containing phosphotransfer protein 1-like [Vigna radiata var. radiata]
MSIYALKFQTHNFIRSMLDDGLVNEQFVYHETARLHPLRRDALLRAVTTYCLASKGLFSAITILLEQQQVDFERVTDLARGLYTRSSSIGAERVKHACAELIQASERKDKDNCSLSLYWTKNRFSCLRDKFETLVKMERSILDLENGQ